MKKGISRRRFVQTAIGGAAAIPLILRKRMASRHLDEIFPGYTPTFRGITR